jgi:adenylate cyclase
MVGFLFAVMVSTLLPLLSLTHGSFARFSVAVCGLPNPRTNHAVALCRFAGDIREIMGSVTNDLEPELGPGTAELKVRIGLHSGPVTAGVLRMDKSRFQIFGDTVNTGK